MHMHNHAFSEHYVILANTHTVKLLCLMHCVLCCAGSERVCSLVESLQVFQGIFGKLSDKEQKEIQSRMTGVAQ